jgi:sensor histidine kinase YesM
MKKMRIAEQENLRLVEEKSKAELSALKEQLSPHFFFNTLSTLSAIVRNEKKEVGLEFIGEISKTYQYTLATKQDLVTLKEEMSFLESYLFLLKKRYGEKLSFSQDLPEDILSSEIPPMSLQLLVENAIQHNVITREKPLHIRIFTEKGMICVENNLQEKESGLDSFGIGLQNLSNRYRLLSQKDIIITKDKQKFGVKLPLL